MEICRCLDDIIQDVEKQNNIIVRARTIHGTLVLIDLYKLKNNPRLEGAEVFKMLFGISDTNPFGRFPMGKDEEGCITILRDLQISSNQWYVFNVFLNTGSVPGYDDYKLGKDYKYNSVSCNIETLQEICVKFGGLPSFDVFRENFYKGETEEKIMTDPKNPEEDNKNKYQWRRVRATGPHVTHPLACKGWSCTSTITVEEGHCSYSYHNYRRDWNWDLTNVIDEIPIDEEEMDYMLDMSNDPLEQTVNTSNELPPWDMPQSLSSEGTGEYSWPPSVNNR